MPSIKRKIINDPVYGFITINHPLIFDIIAHPCYQRLRRINQMAMAQLVYPGAVHTRLHHSLGAYHLMGQAVTELRAKGTVITEEEEIAVKAAILLHDVGHGPFSHALEHQLVQNVHHEELSLGIMNMMNEDLGGRLTLAIQMFTNEYPKPFLHQLISGQLDMDRMDYLTRDSFFTGVSEGVIGYDRILKMLVVQDDELMVEEKGIYSVEKFLIARRQMYWQVYLHKTVLAGEKMLVKILERVRELYPVMAESLRTYGPLDDFLSNETAAQGVFSMEAFCRIDDNDVMFAVKKWSSHSDKVLRLLSTHLLNRKLLKCHIQAEMVPEELILRERKRVAVDLGITEAESGYFVFSGEATNTTYKLGNEHINIAFKDGKVRQISQVDNPLIHQTLSTPVKKFYFCTMAGTK
ncbi:HD domain-containing protein [Filimonas effusa]|uniref:HD domain-containing protein n=1 Tax=Filimonas effusa TaxID=2508721 RepID=A0A4Q1D4L1_9BACT|nr:HD domain-containing protein [Filimonas effusa]RXK83349.1 HD domain-containing protein [Filimonas effusa]